MDIPEYFYPVDFNAFTEKGSRRKKHTLQKDIEDVTKKLNLADISELDIAIIGAPFDNGKMCGGSASSPDMIRTYLYKLAPMYQKINIADLGNLKPASSKKGTLLAIRDIIEYLNEEKVFTVLLGGTQDLTSGICEAFKNNKYNI